MTEVLRALMAAHDSVSQEDAGAAQYWIQLAGIILTDSVAMINQRIKDGLLEAANTPELGSKRRKRSAFLRDGQGK